MLIGEIKVGDRLFWKPGTPRFRRCTVLKVGNIVELMGITDWSLDESSKT
jgi:hypothetical protein